MSARIPVTLIEIDQDQCSLDFGVAPCTATGEPCFNTRSTCKDKENYTLGDPLTLRFSQADQINDHDYEHIPSITSHKTMPTRINVGSRSGRDGALGRRATLDVTMRDLPYSDRLTDPYLDQRSYDPLERGTFWTKWLARNQFYNKRPIRLLEGYEGQALVDMQTRHYILDKIEPPDARGNVRIRAHDILRLADDDKAKAPRLSNGILLSDITSTSTSLVITGGTQSEYTSGYGWNKLVRIGDELIRWDTITEDGNGDLTLNITERGAAETDASAHEADDTVQICLEFFDIDPWEIVQGLLQDYADVPPAYIDFTQWEDEANTWLSGLTATRIISEPTGVNELVGELCEQALFFIWWDDRTQQIPLQAVRPATEDVQQITERDHIIAGSFKSKVKPEHRASEIWVSIDPFVPTDENDKRKYFRRTIANVDTEAQSDFEYDERVIYEVLSLWLRSNIQASLLSSRLLSRYRDTPTYIEFELDAKDRSLSLGDPFDVYHSSIVDQFGEILPVRYQVISQHEPQAGDVIKIEAQKFDFDVGDRQGNWMGLNAPDYLNASESERETGFFWSRLDGTMSNGDDGYLWS